MRPAVLQLDDALGAQTDLRARIAAAGGPTLGARDLGPALRLWSRPRAIDALTARVREQLPAAAGPALVFAGSGDFHHVSPLLIARAVEACGEPVTVLHFDNHPDWVKFDNGLHCGSWVGRAARLPGVERLITVGVCSGDIDRPDAKGADLSLAADGRVELYAYREPRGRDAVNVGDRTWPTIEAMGEGPFVDYLLSRITTAAVYVTIDKDVLRADDAVTNWDQGRTSLAFLETMIRRIAEHHRLVGADVVGDWSHAVYGGGPLGWALKQGEALLDQPWRRPKALAARATNERVNMALMDLFDAVAA
jgi:arginase family enzyme